MFCVSQFEKFSKLTYVNLPHYLLCYSSLIKLIEKKWEFFMLKKLIGLFLVMSLFAKANSATSVVFTGLTAGSIYAFCVQDAPDTCVSTLLIPITTTTIAIGTLIPGLLTSNLALKIILLDEKNDSKTELNLDESERDVLTAIMESDLSTEEKGRELETFLSDIL
jgi:hypothetical protein